MRYLFLLFYSLLSLQAMTLEQSIAYALENNNALKQSDVAIDRSKAVRDTKEAQNYGRLDLVASYDHYNLPRTLAPLTPASLVSVPGAAAAIPTTQEMFTTGIAYNVVLFDGFAQQNAYSISDLQYQTASLKQKLGREELIYNVRNLYLSLLSLEEQLTAQYSYTEAQKNLLAHIKQEHELGSKAKIDVLKAQNSIEASHAQESGMESNIAIIKATLSSLMGEREFDDAEPVEIDIAVAQEQYTEDDDITALKRYRVSELAIKASTRKVEQSRANYYPTIDFGAYYGQNFGPNDADTSYDNAVVLSKGEWNNQEVWQVGLHLKWNLLDFGTTSSAIQASKLEYMNTRLESEAIEIELRKNITIAQNNIKHAAAQYKSALSQYVLLSETDKIEQIRYENNALTLTDLLATRADKTVAHAQLINAKYSYQKARYYLDYLLEKGEN